MFQIFAAVLQEMQLICRKLMVNAIPERNLPVLNFAYYLPKPCTDRIAHVNNYDFAL